MKSSRLKNALLIGAALLLTNTSCQAQTRTEAETETRAIEVDQNVILKQAIPKPAAPPTPPLILVLPMGRFPIEEMQTVTGAIESYYGWRTEVLTASQLPKAAWYEPRKRYRAPILLDWLRPKLRPDAARIMGVTEKDISTSKGKHKDWGICGLADMPGQASLISTYRIKRKLNKFKESDQRSVFLKRLGELAAHEFGHNLGLPHCQHKGCIMEDAKGTVSTFDHSTGKLCDQCREVLKAHQL